MVTEARTDAVGVASQTADAPTVLEVDSLEVTYNRVAVAIQGVSLRVPRGSIVAVLGPNGAGKTTLLRAISGFLGSENGAVTDGRVIFDGKPMRGKRPDYIARQGMVLVPERDKVFTTLTVDENLRSVPARRGGNQREMIDFGFELFPVLAERRKQRAGYLSGGERQMLALAKALMAEPTVLLVDELSLGIAPSLVARMMESVTRIREWKGISVLLVEQNAVAALGIADHAFVMETGRVRLDASPQELFRNDDIRRTYLGLNESEDAQRYGDVTRGRRRRNWYE